MGAVAEFPVTFDNSQYSEVVSLIGEHSVVGVMVEGDFAGAELTFYAGRTVGGSFNQICNADGSMYTLTALPSTYVPVDPTVFAGVEFLKVRSDVSEDSSDQIFLHARRLG